MQNTDLRCIINIAKIKHERETNMKKFTKILALVLCLAMVFALCACGDSGEKKDGEEKEVVKTDSELFVGTWECKVDVTDQLNAELAYEFADAADYIEFDAVYCVFTLTLKDDGTYELSIGMDKSSQKEFESALEEGLYAYLEDALVLEQEQLGMSDEEYEAAYMETYGMTPAELCDETIAQVLDEFDLDDLFGDETEGNWKAKDGKLFMTDDLDDEISDGDYDEYEDLSEDGFTLVKGFTDGVEDDGDMYPMVFTKA